MMIVWGSRLYGKVDVVPGFFHVETKFGHLNYVPLIPVGSFVVLGKQGDQFQGVRIPLSPRSVLLAWLRAATLVVAVVQLALAAALANDGAWPIPAAIGVASLVAFALLKRHRWTTHASYARACRIADHLGLTPEARGRLDAAFGYKDGILDPFAGMRTTL